MSHDQDADDPSQAPVIPRGFLKLDEIQGETQTKWLWYDKFPLGHVTIVAGEAASGKSLLAAEIAARVSRGAGWPDVTGKKPGVAQQAGSVVVAHANVHENLVLKGRLLAAGADPARVAVVNCEFLERDDGAVDPGDEPLPPAEAALCRLDGTLLENRGASLVVIDHLLGWLGRSRLRPEELTEVFHRLAEMAAQYRVALVVLWRLEKGGRAAQTRALDTLAGVAPVVWLLAHDPYSSPARRAVCAQNRLGAQSDDLVFRIEGNRLVWQQAGRQVSADDLLAARTADRHERRQAGQWLLDLLAQGAIEAKLLWHEARECGLAERTLRRAAAELDLHPTKDGKRNVWLWGRRIGSGDLRPTAVAVIADIEGLEDKETRGQRDKEMNCEAQQRVATAQSVAALPEVGRGLGQETGPNSRPAQSVAVLPEVGSLAGAEGSLDNRDGCSTKVGSLADSAVVRVELRPDAPTSVAVLPPVGSLASTSVLPNA